MCLKLYQGQMSMRLSAKSNIAHLSFSGLCACLPACLQGIMILSLDVMDLELEPQMVVSPVAVLRTRALPVPQNKCELFGIYILHNLIKYLFFEKQKQNKSKNAVSCSERPPFPNLSLKGLT